LFTSGKLNENIAPFPFLLKI